MPKVHSYATLLDSQNSPSNNHLIRANTAFESQLKRLALRGKEVTEETEVRANKGIQPQPVPEVQVESMHDLNRRNLELQNQKLEMEVYPVKSTWQNLLSNLTIFGVAIAWMVTSYLQYQVNQYQISGAKIAEERALLSKEKAEYDLRELESQLDESRRDLVSVQSQLDQVRSAIGEVYQAGDEIPFGEPITVSGAIIDSQGKIVPGVKVNVRRLKPGPGRVMEDANGVTDEQGEFSVQFTSGGHFFIWLYPEPPYEMQLIRNLAGNRSHTIVFYMPVVSRSDVDGVIPTTRIPPAQ